MLVRNLDVFPPAARDEGRWLSVNFQPLAAEHISRWRRWFPWLLVIIVVIVLAASAGAPPVLIAALVAIGFGREFYLAVNVVEWLVPSNWPGLSQAERLRIRICLLAMATISGAIALGVVGIVYFLFFESDQPVKWNQLAFLGTYGLLAWPAGRASVKFARKALRRVPPEERLAERGV